MKKLISSILIVMVGIGLFATSVFAAEARTIKHLFKAYTANTAVSQSKVIYRITGYATGSNAKFGIYNNATLDGDVTSNIAVEGGEATSGDALPNMTFGEDGLILDNGSSVGIVNCIIIIEYS